MTDTPDRTMAEQWEKLAEYFEKHCNRYANGACMTLRCQRRGYNYKGGTVPCYDLASCEEHEAAMLIRAAAALRTPPQSRAGEPVAKLKPDIIGVLRSVHSALDRSLGDTDVTHIENEDELCAEYPVQWAAEWLAHAIDLLEEQARTPIPPTEGEEQKLGSSEPLGPHYDGTTMDNQQLHGTTRRNQTVVTAGETATPTEGERVALADELEKIELRLLHGDRHDRKDANVIGRAVHTLRGKK